LRNLFKKIISKFLTQELLMKIFYLSLLSCLSIDFLAADIDDEVLNTPIVLGSIPVGEEPIQMAKYQNRGFVTNQIQSQPNGNVTVFDLNTKLVLGTVTGFGSNPSFIAIQGTTGYVTNSLDNTVSYFNVTSPLSSGSFTVDGSFSVGTKPQGIATTSTKGFVLNKDDNTISHFSLTYPPTSSGSYSLNSLFLPQCIVINGTTAFVTGNTGLCTFDVTTPAPSITYAPSPLISNFYGIAISGTTGYLTNNNGYNITLFNTETLERISEISGPVYSTGIIISGTTGYFGEYRSNIVSLFDTTTNEITSSIPVSNGPLFFSINGTTCYIVCNAGESVNYFELVPYTPPTPDTIPIPSSAPNAAVTASILNQINGVCLPSTQKIIDDIRLLDPSAQTSALNELSPQYKVIQYSLEKLDLLIHKELESSLYHPQEGTHPFIITGYDNLNQSSVNTYNGYSVDSYYQLLGVTHHWKKCNWLFSAGASESYMSLFPIASNATYQTVWGNLGVAQSLKRWQYGLVGLFGYSFLKAHQYIPFLNETASSSHGAYNISIEGKLAYCFTKNKMHFKPYDTLSYLYGQENNFDFYGAPGANLAVQKENLSVLRNILGCRVHRELSSSKRKAKKETVSSSTSLFLDGSWVYEYYIHNNTYEAAFIGTEVFGTFQQTTPTKNFGRVHTGLMGHHNSFEWKLAYTGLFGKHYSESAGSVKFSKKY
jgi:hypothetical protein